MISGPNGSGKSTLIALMQSQNIPLGAYFNADDQARAKVVCSSRELANLSEHEPPARLAGLWVQASARGQGEVRQLREDALLGSKDNAFETAMSHIAHLEHARQAGFARDCFSFARIIQ